MKYDEDTLKWLIDRSNFNVLRLFKNNLSELPNGARYDLQDKGFISRSYKSNKIILTEKGRLFLEETDEE